MVSKRYKFYVSDAKLLDYQSSTLLTIDEKSKVISNRGSIFANREIFDKKTPYTSYELVKIEKIFGDQDKFIKEAEDAIKSQLDTSAIATLKTNVEQSNKDLTDMRTAVVKAIAEKPTANLFNYEKKKLSDAYDFVCTKSLDSVKQAFLAAKTAAGTAKIPAGDAATLKKAVTDARTNCLAEIKLVSGSSIFKTVSDGIKALTSSGAGLGQKEGNLLSYQDARSVYLAKIAAKLYSGTDSVADKKTLDDLPGPIADAMKIEAEIEAKLNLALSTSPTKDDFEAFSKIPVDPKVLGVPFDELSKAIDDASVAPAP